LFLTPGKADHMWKALETFRMDGGWMAAAN
jgi:hypothetical protein